MNRKKVLIVSRREIRKGKLINWVSEVYMEMLAQHNIVPVIVPIATKSIESLDYYLEDYDGLLMVEGGDVDPKYYNLSYPKEKLDEYDPLKDEIEFACAKHALQNNKPVLGLCRGLHIINTLFGGTLHLDVHQANKNSVCHMNYDNYDVHRHKITIFENTPLYEWYNRTELLVNTYHHQGIKKIASGLQIMAKADDELIEGVYHPDYKFVVGLQFHPERMFTEYEGNKKVFEAFITNL